jgi:hypothetical protein
VPNQGTQREINLFGTRRRVGFCNTFEAVCGSDRFSARVILGELLDAADGSLAWSQVRLPAGASALAGR